MDEIDIECINNEKIKKAEVLSKTDKQMKVVFIGTTMTLDLARKDVNKPYVGYKAGLEFAYHG